MIHTADTHPAETGIHTGDGYMMVLYRGGWKRMDTAQWPPKPSEIVLALRWQDREVIDAYHRHMEWRDRPHDETDDSKIATQKDVGPDDHIYVSTSAGAAE